MADRADERLFSAVGLLSNTVHVGLLHSRLPVKRPKIYDLRPRAHDYSLPPKDDQYFITHLDSPVHYVLSPDFCGEYENYTFLESLWHRQSEKQCFHLPRVQYGRHLAFYKMAAMKHVLVNISARY